MSPCSGEHEPAFDPLQYYETPPHLKPPCKLLELPKELLAAIALQVDLSRNRDLCNLALTCKTLQQIAQEALLKPAKLKENGIREFLEMLVHRQDLARWVHHVDLGSYAGKYERGANALPQLSDFELSTHTKFKALVTKEKGADFWKHLFLARESDRWGFGRSYFLALLTVVAPNLDELTFEMRPIISPPDLLVMLPAQMHLSHQELNPPFGGTIMELLGKRLTRLTISNGVLRTPHMHNLSFAGLEKLKYLSVPMGTFVRKNTHIVDPISDILPAGLERLCVRECNHWFVQLLGALKEAKIPGLKYLDLSFRCSLRSALISGCELGVDVDGASVQHRWKQMLPDNVDVFTQTRPNDRAPYEKTKIVTEWEAWSFLSFGEIALASMKDIQFSEIVARNNDGTPRARTDFEVELFRRFWGMNYRLFTSPTFDALAWAGVRMFNGPNTFSKETINAVKALPKHQNQKLKTEIKKKPICKTVFAKKPEMTPAAERSKTFDAMGWCKASFFKQQSHPEEITLRMKKLVAIESPRRRKMVTRSDKIDEVLALATAWKLQLEKDGDT